MSKPPDPQLLAKGDITLKHIARVAGVSIATVSRAINRPSMVEPTKLKAITEVLDQLSYIPNNAARTLLHGRSMTVGMIVPTMSNPLFVPTIEGAEETLQAGGYAMLLACSNRQAERELDQVQTMLSRGVDGLILTGSVHAPGLFDMLRLRSVPAVFQDCAKVYRGSLSIAMQDAKAMALAIDALVGAGHRRIALLTGPTGDTPPVAERVRGARERLKAHGIELTSECFAETPDYEAKTAHKAVQGFLRLDPRPTAIACTGDILALGAVAAIREAGLSVPRDLSIIGCSDSVMAQYVDPPLTTVHLPFRKMGEFAAELLLGQLRAESADGISFMPFQLQQRRSVSAPPRTARRSATMTSQEAP